MGLLINGKWHDQWYDTDNNGGKFVRQDSAFRHWVTADGSAGPRGEAGFKAEPGRYHLYVSLACPWAHRTLILRSIKQLQSVLGVTVVAPLMLENGWEFDDQARAASPVDGLDYLYQLYLKADPEYSGRVTVPVLWDKKRATIVSNESAEIIRMLNQAFNAYTTAQSDYYPQPLVAEIDNVNERVYADINNGVYRAGFATTQQAYEDAFNDLFTSLDWVEERLSDSRYLVGCQLTEADWRLFTTLVRFDAVYFSHFKCNLRRIEDYPNLSNYLRDLYQYPAVADTVDFQHIKSHYYGSHKTINPTGIIPHGPLLDYRRTHDRERFS